MFSFSIPVIAFTALLLLMVGCETQAAKVEENKALVRDEFERWGLKGDETLIDECYAADCVWHGPGGQEIRGRDGMKQLMAVLGAAFPDKRYTIHDMIAEGDKVVARWTFRATHKGEYMGIPATNKQVVFTGIYIIRIADGSQVEWWLEADFLSLMQQLGAIPPMGEGGE
jgi:steroid delta-isomerase-like uncharacterized protein